MYVNLVATLLLKSEASLVKPEASNMWAAKDGFITLRFLVYR